MKNERFLTPQDDLQTALDSAPKDAFVHLAPGIYRQKIVIRTPGLTIIGQGAENTRLVFDDYAQKLDEQGREYVTFRTYTLAVCADGVRLENLAIVNDARFPEKKGQEVALTVYGDDFCMENCRLTSTQDTLFLGPLPPDLITRYDGFLADELRQDRLLRQTFRNCLIEGTVDFIFGCGNALFEACEIRSLADARDIGYIAAPAHSSWQTEGFLFRNCRLTCEDAVTPGSIYLARPWRDYGLVRFENCTLGKHIAPAGFDKWNDTHRDKTARFYESPAPEGRVDWINRKG
ncbi:MAG: pectinesterase family protein [Faecousia sp.]